MVKLVRPDFRELENNAKICAIFEIKPNFAAILPQNIEVLYDGYELDNLKFNPVYSFTNSSFNRQLLSKGTVPEIDDLVNVIINNSAYKNIKRHIKKNPLGEYLDFRYSINVNYITETGEYITDTFDYFAHSKIIGVVNELDYLNTPKIYYSYIALENYMQEHVLNNLSTYYGVKITWYDRILNADNYSYLSSYSYQLFLKDYHYRNYLFDFDIFPEQFSFTSSSLIISDSLFGFVDVAKYALVLFLGISLIGTLVITSIMSFTSYSEDRKVSAILSSLGARNGDIQEIYLNESIITAFISSFIALLLSIPISKIVNSIIQKKISVNGLISIPYLNFLNVPLLYPLLIIFGALLVAYIATIVPIIFSKQKTIKGELQTND